MRSLRFFVGTGATLVVIATALFGLLPYAQSQNRASGPTRPVDAASESVLVVPGSKPRAIEYYRRISVKLNFPMLDGADKPISSLKELIDYAGFEGIFPEDLEKIPSFKLMPQSAAELEQLAAIVRDPNGFRSKRKLSDFENGQILVSRFFAPKIVNYNEIKNGRFTAGWRKLARMKPLVGSRADLAGVSEVHILFNFVKEDPNVDPFDGNSSKNNQVIIVPKSYQLGVEDSAFFMVFEEGPAYPLGFALTNVAFDLPGPKDYYVPTSCAQCHGHDGSREEGPNPPSKIFTRARVNYLDTDQWRDVMGYDFAHFLNTPNGVVFDGGGNVASAEHRRAMDVLRRLNLGIEAQNHALNSADFKAKAVSNWLQNHATNDDFIPIQQRILDLGERWNANSADETEMLNLLNRYCFRCHSSVRYNVFDKAGVRSYARDFEDVLTQAYMPQGRTLSQQDRDRLIELAKKLFP